MSVTSNLYLQSRPFSMLQFFTDNSLWKSTCGWLTSIPNLKRLNTKWLVFLPPQYAFPYLNKWTTNLHNCSCKKSKVNDETSLSFPSLHLPHSLSSLFSLLPSKYISIPSAFLCLHCHHPNPEIAKRHLWDSTVLARLLCLANSIFINYLV